VLCDLYVISSCRYRRIIAYSGYIIHLPYSVLVTLYLWWVWFTGDSLFNFSIHDHDAVIYYTRRMRFVLLCQWSVGHHVNILGTSIFLGFLFSAVNSLVIIIKAQLWICLCIFSWKWDRIRLLRFVYEISLTRYYLYFISIILGAIKPSRKNWFLLSLSQNYCTQFFTEFSEFFISRKIYYYVPLF